MITSLHLLLLPGRFAVCQLPPGALFDPNALSDDFAALVRTSEEVSLVVREENIPEGGRVEAGWRVLKVAGPLDFALTGILASLTAPLADAGIPLFALSTFDTDYLLVKEERVSDTVTTLRSKGHRIEGETAVYADASDRETK